MIQSGLAYAAETDTLRLSIVRRAGRVDAVRLSPSVRTGATAALVGRPVPDALRLTQVLFALCGRSHVVAALHAIEAATARPAPASVQAARRMLVLVEAVEQMARTLLLEATATAAGSPDVETLRAVRRDVAAIMACVAATGWDQVGGGVRDNGGGDGGGDDGPGTAWPAPGLAARVAALVARFDALRAWTKTLPDRAEFLPAAVWTGPAPVGRLVGTALAHRWPDPGPPRPLAEWTLGAFRGPLGAADADAFATRPSWHGAPAVTGALARFAGHPLVSDLWRRGLVAAAGFVARTLDLAQALDQVTESVRGGAQGTAPDRGAAPGALGTGHGLADGPGIGLGAVETARGLLLHRVVLAGGRVAAWRLVAPTEWTFHPDGVVPRAILGAAAPNRDTLARRVRLLLAALDPCVACDLRIEDAAHA
ncbi:hypothetical protein F1188_07605 [Roseospira marina]|uniref:Hydrogenase expression/formation protein HupK n=1 Tax=Roseospira marina TaxID=140057 RepID=A0A5M6IDB5_9PROT|nr:hypothetical protein [Roseospira marina]KAA5606274.1 hypothetical protein F1188_07605 [Roseospira marina]MBB4314432.1 hypothetical protein [Roseospira marina]MBB5087592.1 hypothetical protein [Roseospira marina]